jgi:hypothetical protein
LARPNRQTRAKLPQRNIAVAAIGKLERKGCCYVVSTNRNGSEIMKQFNKQATSLLLAAGIRGAGR